MGLPLIVGGLGMPASCLLLLLLQSNMAPTTMAATPTEPPTIPPMTPPDKPLEGEAFDVAVAELVFISVAVADVGVTYDEELVALRVEDEVAVEDVPSWLSVPV
jgi:hypothetical protein